jgi:hypothetical protein
MKSITQIKFLSENYSTLQGLRSVPVGACLLSVSLWANSIHGPARDITLPITFALGSALLLLIIDRYYKRTFGEVKRTLAKRRVEWIVTAAGVILVLFAFWADNISKLPISFTGLVFAAMFLLGNGEQISPLNNFSITKLSLSIGMLLLSILPILGLNWWNMVGIKSFLLAVTTLVGVFMIAEGFIWHIFLLNSLPATEAANE